MSLLNWNAVGNEKGGTIL